jgi:hypothetical protein
MHEFWQQVFSGLAAGSIYASVALALVMIYRSTDLVNFAQGEMAMFSTYIAWTLVNAGLPFWGAFAITLIVSFVGGMLIERLVIRPVENAPVLAAVVVTIGLLLIFNSVAGWIYSYTVQDFPSPFPDRTLFHALITTRDLGVIAVTLLMLVLLFLFFRFTSTGLAMRAAAQNPTSARLCGIRVGHMLAIGWGLAAASWRHHKPGGRSGRRIDRRRHRKPRRHLSDRQPAQAHRSAGFDHPGARIPPERIVRHGHRAAGLRWKKPSPPLRVRPPASSATTRRRPEPGDRRRRRS